MLPILTPELTLALQSMVLLLTAFLLTAALRRASAALRHHVWTLAFALLLLLPWWPNPKTQFPVFHIVLRRGSASLLHQIGMNANGERNLHLASVPMGNLRG